MNDLNNVNIVKKQLVKASDFWVKMVIFALLCQFGGLYYITYFVADWDTGEPIAYLLGLSIETAGMLYFLRKRGSLS